LYLVLLVPQFSLSEDLVIQLLKVVLCEPVILKELLHFIVNVGCNVWFVTVFDLEFVDEETLELLSLLNV
jgi:hypothetical protein